MPEQTSSTEEGFIPRWQKSSASERANYALFLSELCVYLDVPRPEPSQADESLNTYVIDKAVHYKELDGSTTANYVDLYRQKCFVLEAKQGSNPIQEAVFELGAPQRAGMPIPASILCSQQVPATATAGYSRRNREPAIFPLAALFSTCLRT